MFQRHVHDASKQQQVRVDCVEEKVRQESKPPSCKNEDNSERLSQAKLL
jgi:hypothetical protein